MSKPELKLIITSRIKSKALESTQVFYAHEFNYLCQVQPFWHTLAKQDWGVEQRTLRQSNLVYLSFWYDNHFEGCYQNFLDIILIINLNSSYHTYCQMRFGPGLADIKTCISHGYDMNMSKLIRMVMTITSLTSFP